MKRVILFIVLLFFVTIVFSQDTLLFTNGKYKVFQKVVIDTTDYLKCLKSKGKNKFYHNSEVFSVSNKTLGKRILYKPSSVEGAFTVSQMNSFVNGEIAGRRQKCPYSFVGGVVAGSVPCIGLPLLGYSLAFAPIMPAGYDGIVGGVIPKTANLPIDSTLATDEHFVEGYKQAVKKKRFNNALIGSGIGLVLGISLAFIFFRN